jgi:hypothetical protein
MDSGSGATKICVYVSVTGKYRNTEWEKVELSA